VSSAEGATRASAASVVAPPAGAPPADSRPLPARPVVRVGSVTTPDGARLVWRIDGAESKLPPLLCSNGVGVSTFFWRHIADHFGRTRPVITWDYRGHGQSPVPVDPESMSIASCARDLWAVADATSAARPVLLGHSMGCQVLLEATRLQPSRPSALVPMLGVAGKVMASFIGGERLDPLFRLVVELGSQQPELGHRLVKRLLSLPGLWPAVRALGLVHPDLCPREEFVPYFEHLAALDMRGYWALVRDLLSHDARDLLAQLRLPVLVVAGERDLFAPLGRSEEMAAEIPGAELLVIPAGSHAALVEQPELVQLALEKFLRRSGLA
jgi:pimeloyl-ACP methyl ester carboxylesterase